MMTPILLSLISLFSLFPSAPDSGTTCIPPYWGGILAGSTREREVRKLYGDGFYVDSLGDEGERFYTDPHRRITMVVGFGVDRVVTELRLMNTYEPPVSLQNADFKKMVSRFLDLGDSLGNFHDLRFGSSFDDIREFYGVPSSIETSDDQDIVWTYIFTGHCELEQGITYRFNKLGKVIEVKFFALDD